MPVPYNIRIMLYVLTKTQEDALQIVEQILPMFPPEQTLSLKIIPEMNLNLSIPITIGDIMVQDEYDGSFQVRRFVTHTIGFTARVNYFGEVVANNDGRIFTTNANLTASDITLTHFDSTHIAIGDNNTGNINENWYYNL